MQFLHINVASWVDNLDVFFFSMVSNCFANWYWFGNLLMERDLLHVWLSWLLFFLVLGYCNSKNLFIIILTKWKNVFFMDYYYLFIGGLGLHITQLCNKKYIITAVFHKGFQNIIWFLIVYLVFLTFVI